MKSLLAKLQLQLNAAPWLRWALLAIGILAAMLLLQQLEEVRVKTQNESLEREAALRQMRALEGQDVWLAREKESASLRESVSAQIPIAGTPGVAQAALQGWLGGLGNSISDTESVRISVETAAVLEDWPGMLRLRATLRGGMSPREAINIVRQIESNPNLIIIESIDIRSDTNRLGSFSMNAYYRITDAGSADDADASP